MDLTLLDTDILSEIIKLCDPIVQKSGLSIREFTVCLRSPQ